MACLNEKKVTRAHMARSQYRILRSLYQHGAQSTAQLKGWLTTAAVVRSDLIWLLDRHLIAPTSSVSTETYEDPNITLTLSGPHGSQSTNTVRRTTYHATPHSVARDPLLWRLTSTGSSAAFQGIVVRGGMARPDYGHHWLCPRGTELRRVAAERLRRAEEPLPAPTELDDLRDEVVFLLTAEHSEEAAYRELRAPREAFGGLSFDEQLRCGEPGVERVRVELRKHLIRAAAREYRGPLGEREAASADPQMVRISRASGKWAYRHGFSSRKPGHANWCCTSRAEHDMLGLESFDLEALAS